MAGLRIFPLMLMLLLANGNAFAEGIMNLSIPAPDRLGAGTTLNSGASGTNDGIAWNGPRIGTPTSIVALVPATAALAMTPAITGQSRQLTIASYPAPYFAPYTAQDNSLFGHRGVVSSDTSAFTKWTDVVTREQQELRGPHNQATVAWLAFIEGLRGHSREDQLAAVNDYANRVAYISDAENYGQPDHWATTGEFLARGGDCEDYAIAKYMSLQMLGFDASQMRVVILFDQEKQLRHAVLAVDNGDSVKILDNQNRRIAAAVDIGHYQPIYAISQTSWWRYV